LPAVLLPLVGVLGAEQVARAYWNDLTLLFLGAFLLALMLEHWNLHRRVALAIAAGVGGRPRQLVMGFLLAAALSSMWLNNTACALMLLPIGQALIQALEPDGKRGSSFATALLLALAFGCTLGGLLTPVGTVPNQVLLGILSERLPERPELGFGAWIVATLPIALLGLPFAWWLLTRGALKVGDGNAEGAAVLAAQRACLGPLSAPEARAGLLFAAAALLWILRSDLDLGLVRLPGWERLFPELQLSHATVALGAALAAFLLPSGSQRGGCLLDWEVARKLPLDVLLLLGGGFALAQGISASGLDSHLAAGLAPLLSGLPSWLAVLLLVFLVSALTEVTSNTATVQVVLPLLLSAALAAGVDPLRWMLPATLAASCAFMLPVGTPPNAVVFASGRLEIARMARVGLWMHLAMVLLIALVCELWVVPRLVTGA
jgi:sodium-dependent dicarboxylate transporter 2/3/5